METTAIRPFEFFSRTHFAVTYEMNLDLLVTERTVYGFLDWIGNIGGLYDGLRLFFAIIVGFWNYKFYQSYLISHLFKIESNDPLADLSRTQRKNSLFNSL